MIVKILFIVLSCLFLTTSCGSKKVNDLEASNDTFNRKYKKSINDRTYPMLNSMHDQTVQFSDKMRFYQVEKANNQELIEENDRYFYQLINYLNRTKDKDGKKHEVIPVGNAYFIIDLVERKGTTNNSEKLLYFDYLQFLIDSKHANDNKVSITDQIETVARNDTDNFTDNHFIFTREKITY